MIEPGDNSSGDLDHVQSLHGLIELADQNTLTVRRPIEGSHVSGEFWQRKVKAFAGAGIPDDGPEYTRSIGLSQQPQITRSG